MVFSFVNKKKQMIFLSCICLFLEIQVYNIINEYTKFKKHLLIYK